MKVLLYIRSTSRGHIEVKTKIGGHLEKNYFWHNKPRIQCNTPFSTNFGTLITLEWLFLLRSSTVKMAAKSKMAAKICVVIWIFWHFFYFWHISPKIKCNTSSSNNLSTLITLKLFFFTFQGHMEVKTTMDANIRHYNQSFLQATIVYMVNLYILKY